MRAGCGVYGTVIYLWQLTEEPGRYRYDKELDAFVFEDSESQRSDSPNTIADAPGADLILHREYREHIGGILDFLMIDGAARHSDELFALASNDGSGWLNEIGVENASDLFEIAAQLFGDNYAFSYPWIKPKDVAKKQDTAPLRRSGRIIDAVIAVLKQTAKPLNIREISDDIEAKGLYTFRTKNVSSVVSGAIWDVLNINRKRNPIPGYQIGTSTNDMGQKVFYSKRIKYWRYK